MTAYRLLLLVLVLVLALGPVGCSDPPAAAARRALGKATGVLQVAEVGARRGVKLTLDAVAAQERSRTLGELTAAGCSAATSQPATASPACQTIAETGRTRYLLASRKVAVYAAKVDASVGLAYAAILVAVQTVGEVEVGIGDIKTLSDIVARVLKYVDTVLITYREAKAFYAQMTAGGTP